MNKFFSVILVLGLCAAASAQDVKLSDKELYNAIWAMGQMFPDGFTLDLTTMRQPQKGLMVSYAATQNSFDKKSIPGVVKHARAHNNLVGGWRDPETGKYYFDSTRCFPEDSLAAALAFARENGQHTVYDAGKQINVKSNYEQKECRIIFDCDMGSSTDDLFALMMLYRYMDMKRCTLLGVIVDRMGAANADAVDVMSLRPRRGCTAPFQADLQGSRRVSRGLQALPQDSRRAARRQRDHRLRGFRDLPCPPPAVRAG